MRLHLEIRLDDDVEDVAKGGNEHRDPVLSTFDGAPLALQPGDGTLASGLENLIIELQPGHEHRIRTTGATLFGQADPALMQHMPASDLPNDLALEIGDVIAFATPSGEQAIGTLLERTDESALVDFNNPLIHRALRLRVLILDKD